MNGFFNSFISGLFCTGLLFFISLVSVIGCKVIAVKINRLFPKKQTVQTPIESDKPQAPKKRKRKPSTVRSIEIDPEQIDRIYVKKIS